MMRPVLATLLLFVSGSLFAAAPPRFGVVGGQPEALCLAASGPLVSAGSTITVAFPDGTSQYLATVGDPVATCPALERAAVPGPYYAVGLPAQAMSMTFPAVAIIGASGTLPQVRGCTANGAMYLSAWSGTPLKSKRLWYQYWYLGVDVESTCTKKDMD